MREEASTVANQRWHGAFAVLVILVASFLIWRAWDEDRWSDWGLGDAQTMLSSRQWHEKGWANNYFLFLPQGYFSGIWVLDDPSLRQHAHGISPRSSALVGPRLWYTHYPPGYLIPYATLFALGLDSLIAARLLAVAISLAALVILYLFALQLTCARVGWMAVLFYVLTPPFLGYADALATQPPDDLFRFTFLLAVVKTTRAGTPRRRRAWTAAAWLIAFLMSACSLDSVFFGYLWLLGWDRLAKASFRWRRYLLFALAPLIVHSLQVAQNSWYLGAAGAWDDLRGTFLSKSYLENGSAPSLPPRLAMTWGAIVLNFERIGCPLPLFGALLLCYACFWFVANPEATRGLPSLGLLAVLSLCSLAYLVVLPLAAHMSYEGRQLGLLVSLTAAGATWASWASVAQCADGAGQGKTSELRRPLSLALLATSGLTWGMMLSSDRTSNYERFRTSPDAALARDLGKLATAHEPVIISIGGLQDYLEKDYHAGFPQIHPIHEYYCRSRPILCFPDADRAARDIIRLRELWAGPFSPVAVADDHAKLEYLIQQLRQQGVAVEAPTILLVHGRYVADLSTR